MSKRYETRFDATLMLSGFTSLGTPIDNEIANAIAANVTYTNIPSKHASSITGQQFSWDVDLTMQPFFVIRDCSDAEKVTKIGPIYIFKTSLPSLAYHVADSRFNKPTQSKF